MAELPLAIAFVAGLVSFLSPCVLPLLPGYLVYLAGGTGAQSSSRADIFLNSVAFVFGFSLVFAVLGVALTTLLEQVAYDVQLWLSRVGGIVIGIFGLSLLGLIRLPMFEREYRLRVAPVSSSRLIMSVVFGAAFAAGWTPCVGAVLGGILGLATTQPGSAFTLLLSYSLGFSIPLLLVGLFTSQATALIVRFGRWAVYVNRAFGIILIFLGALIFTQTLNRFANFELLNRLLSLP
ncbi:MAG: cytochrome c biogenesis protein CcdA [Candidatus Andersenbacteria bacterium]